MDNAVFEDVTAHLPRDGVRVRVGLRVVGMPLPCLNVGLGSALVKASVRP